MKEFLDAMVDVGSVSLKTETAQKDVAYYETLPYTIAIRKDEEPRRFRGEDTRASWVYRLMATREASAIENLRPMQRLWLEDSAPRWGCHPRTRRRSGPCPVASGSSAYPGNCTEIWSV